MDNPKETITSEIDYGKIASSLQKVKIDGSYGGTGTSFTLPLLKKITEIMEEEKIARFWGQEFSATLTDGRTMRFYILIAKKKTWIVTDVGTE